MKQNRSLATLIFFIVVMVGGAIAIFLGLLAGSAAGIGVVLLTFVLAIAAFNSVQVAEQWSKVVIPRLGQFRALKALGLFFIIPIIDSISYWIDTRVITTGFKAEKTLTKDTVPVDVDAVLFWRVVDSKRAALDVADYQSAISSASQTALHDVIGKTMLSEMLKGRNKINGVLQTIIDQRTEPWGISVIAVEVKEVLIRDALENAMSMQAQAESERQARVILGDSERQIAEKFAEAAKSYEHNPVAFHLRAMHMLYEGLKENSTLVIVPSTAVESMQLGGLAGLTPLTMGIGQDAAASAAAPAARAPQPIAPARVPATEEVEIAQA